MAQELINADFMQYFINIQTLDEAKTLFKKLCFQLHPDTSGKDGEEFKEMLNQFERFKPQSEKYQGEEKDWNAREYAHIIQNLIKYPDLIIEIVGSFIWVSGNTYAHREEIKNIDTGDSMKRGFSKNKAMWYFSPAGYKKLNDKSFTYEEIKEKYGAERVSNTSNLQLAE